jgi:membrane fusion protein (multidrug efflux system)
LFGACGFALLSTLAGCGHGGQSPAADDNQPVAVSVRKVESKPLALAVEVVGRTEGSREIKVHARVSGILEKQTYKEGLAVKAGAELFSIDPVPYEIALDHARAALAQERATQHQAKRNSDRTSSLAQQNAVSKRQADDALSAVEVADAAVLAAQANLREAEVNLSYTHVVAPIAGIVGRAEQSEGSLVTASSDSSLLTTLVQTDPIWVRFALSAQEYETLRTTGAHDPSALSVQLLDRDRKPLVTQGHVNFAASNVDSTLGTVQLRAEFSNPKLSILPGEYLRVRLAGAGVDGIAVPQTAVLQNAKGPFVWVVGADNHAEQRTVQTGSWIGEEWRILAGLTPGDVLVLDNLLKLHPGQALKIEAASEESPKGTAEAAAAAAPTDKRGG